jgi:Skp family chaperone for outer membrane proteins
MYSKTRAALGALALSLLTVTAAAAQAAAAPSGAMPLPGAQAAAASQASFKFAYVNSAKLMSQLPSAVDAQSQIETEVEGVKAQTQKMTDSLGAMVQAYTQVQATLTPAQRGVREQALRAKQQEFQLKAQQLDQRAQQHAAELMDPIRDQIREIIDGLRVAGGYTVIFDAAAQGGAIVSVDTTLDITDRVLAQLAVAGPPAKPAAKPAAKTTPKPTPVNKPTGVTRPPTP